MVEIFQVAEFVKYYEVGKGERQPDEMQVEVDVAFRRAAAPVGQVVLYREFLVFESVLCGK